MFLEFIADIGVESGSKAWIYVDDSKKLRNVSTEEDVCDFQSDLEQYYRWAKSNNMLFNNEKFVLLRYGKHHLYHLQMIYVFQLVSKESHKDL